DELQGTLRLLVAVSLLPFRQRDALARQLLIRNLLKQMRDEIEPRTPLVIAVHDEPGRKRHVGGREHVVARTRIVVPATVGLEIIRRELPDLARVIDPRLEPAR